MRKGRNFCEKSEKTPSEVVHLRPLGQRESLDYLRGSLGFCFGSVRSEEITEFVDAGHIAEALTLIIDSLHSVNEGDEKLIPACYRKIKDLTPPDSTANDSTQPDPTPTTSAQPDQSSDKEVKL